MPALSTAGTTGKPSPVPKELSPSSRRHGRDGDTVTPSAGPPYPGQGRTCRPSLAASRPRGVPGTGLEASPAPPQRTKAPCFPEFPGETRAAQPGSKQAPPGRRRWATPPAFTPPRHPGLWRRGRKLRQPQRGQFAPLWPVAGSHPGHHGRTATIPRVPRALPLPPQPSPVLGASIRDSGRCRSHGTGACRAL